jgi:hypothetical protein
VIQVVQVVQVVQMAQVVQVQEKIRIMKMIQDKNLTKWIKIVTGNSQKKRFTKLMDMNHHVKYWTNTFRWLIRIRMEELLSKNIFKQLEKLTICLKTSQ